MIKTCLAQFSLVMLIATSPLYAAPANFNCPPPEQIQSTDFTAPSIWIAPPVAHSIQDTVGIGLGGKNVKEFLGAEAATVNHKNGWVCVYKSEGGLSPLEYKNKIKQIVGSNHFLSKYTDKIDRVIEDAEPYLKKYPQDSALGFVGYQENPEMKK